MRKILIVDDEHAITDILEIILQKEYQTAKAFDGEEALEKYESFKPDLILLDVMLPKLDGFDVCRRIREKDTRTSIIMLTARADEQDRILGLEIGADDYVGKPFVNREVILRIEKNMRHIPEETVVKEADTGLIVDDERVDAFREGNACELTPREYELLKFLMASPQHVFSREDLLRSVWQYDYFGDVRAVDVCIRRLREKIEPNAADPKYIITKRGAGYYYSDSN